MAATSIQWTDHSINPIRACDTVTNAVGHYCQKISSGCANCYASTLQKRFQMPEFKGVSAEPGTVQPFLDESKLIEVMRRKKATRYFWCDMTDLFGAWVPDGWIMRCLDVWAQTFQHTHQILTKRPDRMRDFFTRWADLKGEDFQPKLVRGPEATRKAHPSGRGQLFAAMLETMGEPPAGCAYPTFDWMEGMISWPSQFRNVWLGTSIENQQTADERIPDLIRTPAAIRFLSCEPLLGPIDLSKHLQCESCLDRSVHWCVDPVIHWVIVGGESGPSARPCNIEWIRSIVRQCKAARVPVFVKQLGSRPFVELRDMNNPNYRGSMEFRTKDRKGGDMESFPEDLRVREFPQ